MINWYQIHQSFSTHEHLAGHVSILDTIAFRMFSTTNEGLPNNYIHSIGITIRVKCIPASCISLPDTRTCFMVLGYSGITDILGLRVYFFHKRCSWGRHVYSNFITQKSTECIINLHYVGWKPHTASARKYIKTQLFSKIYLPNSLD